MPVQAPASPPGHQGSRLPVTDLRNGQSSAGHPDRYEARLLRNPSHLHSFQLSRYALILLVAVAAVRGVCSSRWQIHVAAEVDVNHLRGPTGSLPESMLDSLDRPGGHIAVLVLLVVIGCISGLYNIAWADRIALGALSVLLFLLGGKMAPRP